MIHWAAWPFVNDAYVTATNANFSYIIINVLWATYKYCNGWKYYHYASAANISLFLCNIWTIPNNVIMQRNIWYFIIIKLFMATAFYSAINNQCYPFDMLLLTKLHYPDTFNTFCFCSDLLLYKSQVSIN